LEGRKWPWPGSKDFHKQALLLLGSLMKFLPGGSYNQLIIKGSMREVILPQSQVVEIL